MLRPFQCLLCYVHENTGILLAASGSSIYSFDLFKGNLLSRWPHNRKNESTPEDASNPDTNNFEDDAVEANEQQELERPLKRLKNSPSRETPGDIPIEFLSSDDLGDNSNIVNSVICQSTVIKLAGPTKGRFIVAVTGDKSIRVLHLSLEGTLKQLSERPMPKRPCSVVLTPDEKTILCADKFGDVYSLPLIVPSLEVLSSAKGILDSESHRKPFVPAANSQTVHTRRNQIALQNQQKLIKQTCKKKSLEFDHQLLLGHVSLLTDLKCVSIIDRSRHYPIHKTYILTSDRDEHIRVSRGIPQTHVIEGYCLGHTDFVSRLCIPSWNRKILISGGGDDFLVVWNWISGEIRQKADLKDPINYFKRQFASNFSSSANNEVSPSNVILSSSGDYQEEHIAVSGIWALQISISESKEIRGGVVVACEGLPALFIFSLDTECNLLFVKYFTLPGNVIDVTVLPEKSMLIYSLDNYHKPFSTTAATSASEQLSRPMIGYLSVDELGDWKDVCDVEDAMECMERSAKAEQPAVDPGSEKDRPLGELLYGIENLRKRGQEEQD